MNVKRRAPYWVGLAMLTFTGCATFSDLGPGTALSMPEFRYEVDWLKAPAGLTIGEVVAVAIDRQDHVWVLHRPRTVRDRPATQVAPPIMEFDTGGRYVRGFGGPGEGYEWPTSEHTIALAANGNVWIAGNNRNGAHGDGMVLVFNRKGRFVRQIGSRSATKGNFDTDNFDAPADIYIDDTSQEAYIADGYGNQRVIVLDAKTGVFSTNVGRLRQAPAGRRATRADRRQHWRRTTEFLRTPWRGDCT